MAKVRVMRAMLAAVVVEVVEVVVVVVVVVVVMVDQAGCTRASTARVLRGGWAGSSRPVQCEPSAPGGIGAIGGWVLSLGVRWMMAMAATARQVER